MNLINLATTGEDNSGAVLFELAIAMFFLIILFLGSSEYSRALQMQQTMSVFTREAANATFRDCLELDAPAKCVTEVYDRIYGVAAQALPSIRLLVSVYSFDPAKTAGTELKLVTSYGTPGTSTRLTEAAIRDLHLVKVYQVAIKKEVKFVVAETFSAFQPIMAPNFATKFTEFYDVNIY